MDRKSTSGGCQLLDRKLVSWQSKKQTCVAISTVEAEYISAAACTSQIIWIQSQLRDYAINMNMIPLYCDSQSAIRICHNPVQHSKTKHIALRYHFTKIMWKMRILKYILLKPLNNLLIFLLNLLMKNHL